MPAGAASHSFSKPAVIAPSSERPLNAHRISMKRPRKKSQKQALEEQRLPDDRWGAIVPRASADPASVKTA
jgi:hypothetical protein